MPINISLPINISTSNTLITTKTHHAPFKAESQVKNSAVSSMARPSTNGDISNAHDYVGKRAMATVRRPFPMKHWRKQLNPTKGSGRSKVSIFDMDRPGGSTILNKDECACEENNNSTAYTRTDFKALNQNLPENKHCHPDMVKVLNEGYVQVGEPDKLGSYRIYTGLYDTKYIGYCPKTNIIRSGRTNISKAYNSSTKQYLQSRCKTYEQKLSINKIYNDPYAEENNLYSTGTCPQNSPPRQLCNTTVYKTSNTPFATNGAVSSSTRLLKLQVDTITQNGNSFYSAWGAEGANAGKYQGTSMTPYFLKNKYTVGLPRCYGPAGSKSSC